MVWFKVDDALAMHVKAFGAGNKALGLWVRSGSWAMQQLTDGHIPSGVVTALGGDWDDAAALINAGLWHQADGGYQFHDWAEYQPTREQIEAERAKTRERVEKHRANKSSNGDGNGVTNGGRTGAPSRPVPTPTTTYVPESKSLDNRARSDEKLSTTEERMAAQFGVQPERVQRKVADQLGINLPLRSALSVAVHILSKPAQAPRTPMPYVLGAITRSPAEVAQYIHELGLEAA
jgi:hypothetical protein